MSEPIISVENLGKKYLINHQVAKQSYKSLRETVTNGSKALVKRLASRSTNDSAASAQHAKEEFWALKDVSFDVQQGEVLGVVGRNGAGKSTLLKVLSRITEPTEGRVRIRGRMASLLEVGTGFHPELSGRENIFLNGSILGMSKAEIQRKFDEIVAFAEIEQFLDTPVKRYSSGMYVRLAFSVAAHLDPEILIVDEVLAVGDAQFQAKCLGKMKEVSRGEGRTVLFVSHNLSTIKALCSSGVLLRKGHLSFVGKTNELLEKYVSSDTASLGTWRRDAADIRDVPVKFSIVTLSHGGSTKSEFDFMEYIEIKVNAHISQKISKLQLAVRFTNQEGIPVFTTCSTDADRQYRQIEEGPVEYRIRVPGAFLSPGRYLLQIAAHTPRERLYDIIDNEIALIIHETGSLTEALRDDRQGIVNPKIEWTVT